MKLELICRINFESRKDMEEAAGLLMKGGMNGIKGQLERSTTVPHLIFDHVIAQDIRYRHEDAACGAAFQRNDFQEVDGKLYVPDERFQGSRLGMLLLSGDDQ